MRGPTVIRISPPDSRAVYKLYSSAEALLPRAEKKSRTIVLENNYITWTL